MMTQLILLRPWFLLLLLPLTIIWWWRRRDRQQNSHWQAWIDPNLLSFLRHQNQPQQQRRWYSLMIIWLLATLALSGPSLRREHDGDTYLHDTAKVLLFDLTVSMQADDIKPSRLARAKLKAMDWLKQHQEGQTALVVYSGSAHIVVPFSTDTRTITALLPTLDSSLPPVAGNDPVQALRLIEQMRQNSGIARVDVMWITDGIDQELSQALADVIKTSNLRLSILAVGSDEGAPVRLPDNRLLTDNHGQIVLAKVDHGLLMRFAQQHHARYTSLQADDGDLRALEWPLQQSDEFRDAETVSLQWQDIGGWLCVFLLPLVLWSLRRATVFMFLPAMLLLHTPDSRASWWSDLWQTPDQQAANAMDKGDYAAAAQQFQRHDWKASAQYRNGQFAEAADNFAHGNDVRSTFNRANALAYAQRYDEAEKAFEKALQIDPRHQPAKENLAALREFLKKQSQQQAAQNGQSNDKSSAGQDAADNSKSPSTPSSSPSEQAREPSSAQADKEGKEKGDVADKKDSQSSEPKKEQQAQNAKAETGATDEKKAADTLADGDSKPKNDPQVEAMLRQLPDDPSRLLRQRMKLELLRRGQTESGSATDRSSTEQQNKW